MLAVAAEPLFIGCARSFAMILKVSSIADNLLPRSSYNGPDIDLVGKSFISDNDSLKDGSRETLPETCLGMAGVGDFMTIDLALSESNDEGKSSTLARFEEEVVDEPVAEVGVGGKFEIPATGMNG